MLSRVSFYIQLNSTRVFPVAGHLNVIIWNSDLRATSSSPPFSRVFTVRLTVITKLIKQSAQITDSIAISNGFFGIWPEGILGMTTWLQTSLVVVAKANKIPKKL